MQIWGAIRIGLLRRRVFCPSSGRVEAVGTLLSFFSKLGSQV
jgi:hypothetical protein